MSGNTFGKQFCVTTFGESHGLALGCIVDGCPPRLPLSEADIQPDLDRRKPGKSHFTSKRCESDRVAILSGIFKGKTTGTPIALQILNEDVRNQDYDTLKDIFRPGHGDLTYYQKYGYRDYRGGGRASARETVARVSAAAIAKKYLQVQWNINFCAFIKQIGNISAKIFNFDSIHNNDFYFPDPTKLIELEQLIRKLQYKGDSVGARINLIIKNVPPGLGEPVFDKLDADLAYALMGIPGVKGVEIGLGFSAIHAEGSKSRDKIMSENFASNHAGGILAGISTGQDILVSLAFKPTSSIRIPIETIDIHQRPTKISVIGRHDPCIGIRAIPIVEAMAALVIMDHSLRDGRHNELF